MVFSGMGKDGTEKNGNPSKTMNDVGGPSKAAAAAV